MRDKFGRSEERLAETEEWIRSFTRLVVPKEALDIIKEDPPDNRILECAEAAGSEFIVTGDKDLLRIKRHGGVRIVKVADFLAMGRER